MAAYKGEDNIKMNMKEFECVMGVMYLSKGISHDFHKNPATYCRTSQTAGTFLTLSDPYLFSNSVLDFQWHRDTFLSARCSFPYLLAFLPCSVLISPGSAQYAHLRLQNKELSLSPLLEVNK